MYIYTYIDAYIYIEERITGACMPHIRAHLCVRVYVCVFGRTRIRTETCENFPSARTACGLARRHSTRRRRSTRTSACGTPHASPLWTMYAPHSTGGTPCGRCAQGGLDAARPLCVAALPMRARARV